MSEFDEILAQAQRERDAETKRILGILDDRLAELKKQEADLLAKLDQLRDAGRD